ncbi:hypothetical protein [Pseudomonas sp. BIC9C]|uniref:hypothetical protein n=1 Tax=Pseudomonas sp. BIC9C TaxID=3078458 RepID=UPI002AD1F7BB|nr:hypothetical protein [Pseudomonas sp. BIC9C]
MKQLTEIRLSTKGEKLALPEHVTLPEYLVYSNTGDKLIVLGDEKTITGKTYEYVRNNDYSITIHYE